MVNLPGHQRHDDGRGMPHTPAKPARPTARFCTVTRRKGYMHRLPQPANQARGRALTGLPAMAGPTAFRGRPSITTQSRRASHLIGRHEPDSIRLRRSTAPGGRRGPAEHRRRLRALQYAHSIRTFPSCCSKGRSSVHRSGNGHGPETPAPEQRLNGMRQHSPRPIAETSCPGRR